MEVKEKYSNMLPLTLRGARLDKNLTLDDLAEKTGIRREVINYAEIGTRSLKLEEIMKIADVLEVSIDYLLGRVKEENAIAFDINIKEWGNNTLGSFDKFMKEVNENHLSFDMNAYIFVSYANNNILEEILNKIRRKIESKQELRTPEIRRTTFLYDYIKYVCCQKAEIYQYLRFLVEEQWHDNYECIEKECYQLSEYYKNKEVKINFEEIEKLQAMLKVFETYLSYKVDSTLKKCKEDMVSKINKQDNYFRKISKFFKEVNNY